MRLREGDDARAAVVGLVPVWPRPDAVREFEVVPSDGSVHEVMAHLPLDFLIGKPTHDWDTAVKGVLRAPR